MANSTDSKNKEIYNLRFWVLLFVGVACILGASFWDSYILLQEHNTSIKEDEEKLELILMHPKTWINVSKEIGFASLIALALTIFVERESRIRQEEAAEKQQKTIAENVFRGVFNRCLPDEIVTETVDTIFKTNVIRKQHISDLTLEDFNENNQFVKLIIRSNYVLTNISNTEEEIFIRLEIPSGRIKDIARIEEIKIDNQTYCDELINSGLINDENDKSQFLRYQWPVKIKPGSTVPVESSYVLLKDRSDNEVWRSLYPSLGMAISLTVNSPNMDFGAHALHRNEVVKVSGYGSGGIYRWSLNSAILPHQGIVVWWRPKESGQEVV